MTYRFTVPVVLMPVLLGVLGAALTYLSEWSSDLLVVALFFAAAYVPLGIFNLIRARLSFAFFCFVPIVVFVLAISNRWPIFYLQKWGFLTRVELVENYLASCHPKVFAENGVQQSVGLCDIIHPNFDGGSVHYIIYDTTGSIDRPVIQRTQEWREAARTLFNGGKIADLAWFTTHIYGPFYDVEITLADADKSSS